MAANVARVAAPAPPRRLAQYRHGAHRFGQLIDGTRISAPPGAAQQDPVTAVPAALDLFGDVPGDIVLVDHQTIPVGTLQPRRECEPATRKTAVAQANGSDQLRRIGHEPMTST